MQQGFISSVYSALSPPCLYTLIKKIRFQSFTFHANATISAIMLVIWNIAIWLSICCNLAHLNPWMQPLCIAANVFWNYESIVCYHHYFYIVFLITMILCYQQNLTVITCLRFDIFLLLNTIVTVVVVSYCNVSEAHKLLMSHRNNTNTAPINKLAPGSLNTKGISI